MLRDLNSYHRAPFIQCFKVDFAGGGTPGFSLGRADLNAFTDNGVGDTTLNLKNPYTYRNASVVDIAAFTSAYHTNGNVSQYIDTAAFDYKTIRTVNGGADLNCDVIALGWRTLSVEDVVPSQNVYCNLRNPRMLAFNISSAGVATEGADDATVSKVSSGKYKIIYRNPFGKTPVAKPCMALSSQGRCGIIAAETNATQLVFETYNSGGSLTDSNTSVIVIGTDSQDDTGGVRQILKLPSRAAVLGMYGVNMASSNAVAYGNNEGGFTDNGAGDGTITFSRGKGANGAYLRDPVVVAQATSSGSRIDVNGVSTADAKASCRFVTRNTAGTAGDSLFMAMWIGYQEATRYRG